MTEQHPRPQDAGAQLAMVIPLSAGNRDRSAPPTALDDPPPVDGPPVAPQPDLDRAQGILERCVGARWAQLPVGTGRAGLRAEVLLQSGLTAIDPTTIDAGDAVARAERVVRAAAALVDLLADETDVLSEALAADVITLPFDRLHQVAEAVVALSTAPRAVPAWGDRAEADAAEVVLRVSEADLRDASESHGRLYERFTEGIWDVPSPLVSAGRRRWRLVTRTRLRRRLRAVSRTGRLPGRLTAVAAEVLDARATRSRLNVLSPLLSHHLAELDRGPLTDIDAVLSALTAVRNLQQALGDLLDGTRLERLLMADAFRSPDVVGPAAAIRSTLDAWANDIASVDGNGAWATDGFEIERWAIEVAQLLPVLIEGNEAVRAVAAVDPTLSALVDGLLLRDDVHVHAAHDGDHGADDEVGSAASGHAWSAS